MTRFTQIAAALAVGAFVVSLSPIVTATPAAAEKMSKAEKKKMRADCRAQVKEKGLKGVKKLKATLNCYRGKPID